MTVINGQLLDDNVELTLSELCQVCQLNAEQLIALIDEGIIEPVHNEPGQWRFTGMAIRRARCAIRLQQDLGVNRAGAALALDLLDEIRKLRARLNLPDFFD